MKKLLVSHHGWMRFHAELQKLKTATRPDVLGLYMYIVECLRLRPKFCIKLRVAARQCISSLYHLC